MKRFCGIGSSRKNETNSAREAKAEETGSEETGSGDNGAQLVRKTYAINGLQDSMMPQSKTQKQY